MAENSQDESFVLTMTLLTDLLQILNCVQDLLSQSPWKQHANYYNKQQT